jgi:uncharacterized protein DUF695
VPFLNPNEHCLPTDEEAHELDELEENIERALAENDDAILVASITTDGMREFVFYATEWKPQYFEQKVNEAAKDSNHEPQFMMQKDSNWDDLPAVCEIKSAIDRGSSITSSARSVMCLLQQP